MPSRGKFITLEGGEGAGKSTQTGRLVEMLQQAGIPCIRTREPGGTPEAEAIRALLVTGAVARWDAITEVLLHFAARREHLVRKLEPALAEGTWVVSDRFTDSTIAYQGYGHRLGREMVERIGREVVGDFSPDLTFVLDIPVELGLERTGDRSHAENRYERMGPDFHERLRQGFRDIASGDPRRCRLVDASQGADAVFGAIWSETAAMFGLEPAHG
jgi:dTMP kinase